MQDLPPPSEAVIRALLAENSRLKTGAAGASRATLYVMSIVVLSALTVIAVLAVTVIRPNQDNTALIATLLGVTVPTIAAFLAAVVQQVHLAVNSRLSQLLELTAVSSKAEGVLASTDAAAAAAAAGPNR